MKVIKKERGMGKTTELCRLVKKNNGILLTRSHHFGLYCREAFGLNASQVMTWDDAVRGHKLLGIHNRPIYGDDLDWFLEVSLGQPITAVATS